MPFYLLELAGEFHRYYNKPRNRIIGPERELSLSRLYLASLLKIGPLDGSRVGGRLRSGAHVKEAYAF